MTKRTCMMTARYLIDIDDVDSRFIYYRDENLPEQEIRGFLTKDGKFLTPVLAFIQHDAPTWESPDLTNKTLISADQAEEAGVDLVGIDLYMGEYNPEEF